MALPIAAKLASAFYDAKEKSDARPFVYPSLGEYDRKPTVRLGKHLKEKIKASQRPGLTNSERSEILARPWNFADTNRVEIDASGVPRLYQTTFGVPIVMPKEPPQFFTGPPIREASIRDSGHIRL